MTANTMYLILAVVLAVICTVSSDCSYEDADGLIAYKYCTDSCCGYYYTRYCCDSYDTYYDSYSYSYDYYYSSVYVLSTGAIVGTVIGSLVGLAIFITIIVVICRVCCGASRPAQPGTVVMRQQPQGVAVIQTSQISTTQQAGMAYPPPQQRGNINHGYNPSMAPPPAAGYAGSSPVPIAQMAPPPYPSK